MAIFVSVLWACSQLQPVVAGELELSESEDTIRVTLNKKPVLEYVKKARPIPEGIPKHSRRTGYIHPVFSPGGQQVTGDYPADHAHQHALFFAWTKSTYDGQKVDFWNQAKQLAGVEFRNVLNIERKQDSVSFSVRHAFMVGKGSQKVDALYETWTVTVHATSGDYFLFDIESIQECAGEKPLLLNKYHYGGMAFRANSEWLADKKDDPTQTDSLFLTSEGKARQEGNHTRPDWVAMSGSLNGEDVSLAVFSSPRNFRAPQHVRLHPTKPYFCFAPMVEAKFSIDPGEQYVSRYRYLITSKTVDSEMIEIMRDEYYANELATPQRAKSKTPGTSP